MTKFTKFNRNYFKYSKKNIYKQSKITKFYFNNLKIVKLVKINQFLIHLIVIIFKIVKLVKQQINKK